MLRPNHGASESSDAVGCRENGEIVGEIDCIFAARESCSLIDVRELVAESKGLPDGEFPMLGDGEDDWSEFEDEARPRGAARLPNKDENEEDLLGLDGRGEGEIARRGAVNRNFGGSRAGSESGDPYRVASNQCRIVPYGVRFESASVGGNTNRNSKLGGKKEVDTLAPSGTSKVSRGLHLCFPASMIAPSSARIKSFWNRISGLANLSGSGQRERQRFAHLSEIFDKRRMDLLG